MEGEGGGRGGGGTNRQEDLEEGGREAGRELVGGGGGASSSSSDSFDVSTYFPVIGWVKSTVQPELKFQNNIDLNPK